MLETKNIIIKGLYEHLSQPVIPNDDVNNRPSYPFVDYSLTAQIDFDGLGNEVYTDYAEDLKNTLEIEPQASISFNAYSNDDLEAFNLAKKMWDYFKHIGINDLRWNNIVIVTVYPIENRTVLEVDEYEIRYGFDVIFRYTQQIERIDKVVETYNIIRSD